MKTPENYYGFIYKTIFPNGKIYIGQTTKRVEVKYFGSGVKVYNFIKTYGDENLTRQILKFCDSQEQLDKFENVFITKYKSCDKNIGYNILPGTSNKFGCGSPMKIKECVDKMLNSRKEYLKTAKGKIDRIKQSKLMKKKMGSEESRKFYSELFSDGRFEGEKNPNFGNFWNEKQKEDLRNKMLDRYEGEKNPNFGNKWSNDKRKEMSLRFIESGVRRGENNSMFNKKRITNGIINTVIESGSELPEGFRFGMVRGLKR